MPCYNLSFLCGQALIMYDLSFCKWASSCVASCMSSMDVHRGIFTDMLMTFTFTFMPEISWPLFSAWLIQGSQSVMCRSGPGLYMMCTLYCHIFSIIHWKHWYNMATSLLSIANNGLWWVTYFPHKAVMVELL